MTAATFQPPRTRPDPPGFHHDHDLQSPHKSRTRLTYDFHSRPSPSRRPMIYPVRGRVAIYKYPAGDRESAHILRFNTFCARLM